MSKMACDLRLAAPFAVLLASAVPAEAAFYFEGLAPYVRKDVVLRLGPCLEPCGTEGETGAEPKDGKVPSSVPQWYPPQKR